MFEFAASWVLLLILLPLCILFWVKPSPHAKHQQNYGVIVPFYQQLTQTHYGDDVETTRPSLLRLIIMGLIWILLVIAAAKPQWVGEPQAITTSGRDLLLAVDISGSMEEKDMTLNNRKVSRLVAVKAIVGDFIQARQGDRIGLVLFGENAYLQTPLTFDTASVNQFLQEAQLGFAGSSTAIGDAIGLSVKRLKDRPLPNDVNRDSNNSDQPEANDKVIILLTDGANTSGEVEPLQAAKLAATIGAKIYTIGMGADRMMVRGFFGNRMVNPSASLDEPTLQTIADTTSGRYFRARDTKELNAIYKELDILEPVEREKEWLRPTVSFFMWPLGLALAMSLLGALALHRAALVAHMIRIKHLTMRGSNHG